MFERVIIASSRTDSSVDVLARIVTSVPVKEAIVSHCIESVLPAPTRDKAMAKRATEELNTWVEQCAKIIDIPLKADVRIGIPAHQMLQAAREYEADTIIMSAFVGTPWGEFFLGSTTLEIIRNGTTNMLVLQPPGSEEDAAPQVSRPLLEHVLFPTDFSDFSLTAYDKFITCISCGLKKITLLHVQDAARIEPHLIHRLAEFDEVDQVRLDEMAHKLNGSGVEVDTAIELGIPEHSIIRQARKNDVSCIVIGSRGRSTSAALRWGSVSERVVRAASRPVLILK